ncbi:hypothetical protein [Rhodococcus cercidiphylli]|uniref:Uncharacterized protein n=1 Tax=Rhodococcus cercidiphylli TaxID=489916 RepID=A0ABU4B3E2_9NOCA|nr:hypothetical protein [Rhodococcus cercidiphylli]MDV6232985.1 hypothetical protein [Rhodococcus cercidiphylli]
MIDPFGAAAAQTAEKSAASGAMVAQRSSLTPVTHVVLARLVTS